MLPFAASASRRGAIALACVGSLLLAVFPAGAQNGSDAGRALLFQFYITIAAASTCNVEASPETWARFYKAAAKLEQKVAPSRDEIDNTTRQIQNGARDNPTFCSSYRSVAQSTLRSFE